MAGPTASSERRAVIEAVVASTIGTTIEWYDFFLYGTAAALVFPHLFFPELDPRVGQIASLSTYAVGFLARPVGGVIFGYFGDRFGRKSTLVATLLLMGISTFLIGFLPTYNRIGVWAPVLLVVLRFLQGLGVGGEWGGAVLLALEFGHRGRRGFYASWPQAGVPLGSLASTGVVFLFQKYLGAETFLEWGWRLPFFLSGLLIAVGLLIRVRIFETPLFAQVRAANEVAKTPVRETLARHWREVLLAAGARICEQSCFYLFSVYVISYNKTALHFGDDLVLLAVNVAAAVEFFTIPFFGVLSDHWTRRRTYAFGCLFLAAFALPYYGLLHLGTPAGVVVATVLGLAVGHASLYGVQASLIPELFGTRLRYTGASLGYQLASPVAGGLSPLLAAELVRRYPGRPELLAEYIILIAVLSLVCVQALAETSRKDISAHD